MSACNHSRLIQLGGDPRADPRAHCWYYSLDDPGGAKGELVYFSKSATTVTQTWISCGKEMEDEINWCNCGNHHSWELKPITPVNHAKKSSGKYHIFFWHFSLSLKWWGQERKSTVKILNPELNNHKKHIWMVFDIIAVVHLFKAILLHLSTRSSWSPKDGKSL